MIEMSHLTIGCLQVSSLGNIAVTYYCKAFMDIFSPAGVLLSRKYAPCLFDHPSSIEVREIEKAAVANSIMDPERIAFLVNGVSAKERSLVYQDGFGFQREVSPATPLNKLPSFKHALVTLDKRVRVIENDVVKEIVAHRDFFLVGYLSGRLQVLSSMELSTLCEVFTDAVGSIWVEDDQILVQGDSGGSISVFEISC